MELHNENYLKLKNSCKSDNSNLLSPQQLQKEQILIKNTLSSQNEKLSIFDKEKLTKYLKTYELAIYEIRKMKSQFTKPSIYNQKLYDIFQNQQSHIDQKQIDWEVQSSEIQIKRDKRIEQQPKINIKDVSDNGSTIKNFFKKKQKQLEDKSLSSIGFKNILKSQDNNKSFGKSIQKSQPSSYSRSSYGSSFRKKPVNKQAQLQKILQQNRKLKQDMDSRMKKQLQLNQFQKNLLKQQKQRYMLKIQQMQNQIENLYRDNYRLKESQEVIKKQKGKQIQQGSFNQVDEKPINVYEPYVMKTKHNDLARLNQKWDSQIDVLGQKLQKQVKLKRQSNNNYNKSNKSNKLQILQKKNNSQEDNFILKDLDFDQIQPNKDKSKFKASNDSFFNNNNYKNNYTIDSNGNHFDSFSIVKSSYLQTDEYQQSDTNKFIDSVTSTRNKVAFFKNSLILIKNQTFQLAYKRSSYGQRLDKVRLIFFIQNKTNQQLKIDFNYQFNAAYFKLKVNQKLEKVMPNQQSREDLQINLYSKEDLNQIIDLMIQVNGQKYGIWAPISWIQFSANNNFQMPKITQELIIIPDKQFKNLSCTKKVIPYLMYEGKDRQTQWGYLYGTTKFGECYIKLTWQNSEIKIEADKNVVDLIGFILHYVK